MTTEEKIEGQLAGIIHRLADIEGRLAHLQAFGNLPIAGEEPKEPPMPDETVTLAFVSQQIDRVLDRLGTVEDHLTVLTGICMRLDGSVEGLATEMRGMYRLLDRLGRRVRKL
jgi:hypothetical protein